MNASGRTLGRIRSGLYVPGHRERMLEKAIESEADCIYFDLEDSVPPDEKDKARELVAAAIPAVGEKLAYVRVNGLGTHRTWEDIDAVMQEGLDGILLPKCDTVTAVNVTDYLLSMGETSKGVSNGRVAIGALAETASSIVNCRDILATSPRVVGVSVGVAEDGDLQTELGYTRTESGSEVLYAMTHVLVQARSVGIQSIMAGPYAAFEDYEGLRREAQFAKDLGFTGKSAIHPRQLAIINDVFSYSDAELDYFRRLIDAMDEAEAKGLAATTVDGKMVDIAMVKRATRVLAHDEERA